MNILAIIGSPRKMGNTYRVVEQIHQLLLGYDKGIGFEYLFLKDMNLQMCAGCFACIAKGEDTCPHQDDRAMILSRMLEADGIILAAPCYAMGVPGLMKNFIDRFAYTMHRPCFFDKSFLAVTTVGGVMGMKQALDQLAILAAGAKLAGRVGVSKPPIPMAGFDAMAEKSTRKAARVLYRSLLKKKRRMPGFGDWAYFHSFKTFTSFDSYQKVCPADYAYYREKGEYFYPLEGHHLRRLAGKAFNGIMRVFMKRIIIQQ